MLTLQVEESEGERVGEEEEGDRGEAREEVEVLAGQGGPSAGTGDTGRPGEEAGRKQNQGRPEKVDLSQEHYWSPTVGVRA